MQVCGARGYLSEGRVLYSPSRGTWRGQLLPGRSPSHGGVGGVGVSEDWALLTGAAPSDVHSDDAAAGVSSESHDNSEPDTIPACKADRLVEMSKPVDNELQSKSL